MWRCFKRALHYVISALILFGGAFTSNCTLLKFHLLLCLVVVVHWLTNNNRCMLSEEEHDNPNGYTLGLLRNVGIVIPEDDVVTANIVAYAFVLIPAWYTLMKLHVHCQW